MDYLIFFQSSIHTSNSLAKLKQFLFPPENQEIGMRDTQKVFRAKLKQKRCWENWHTSYDMLSTSILQSLNRSNPSDLPPNIILFWSINIWWQLTLLEDVCNILYKTISSRQPNIEAFPNYFPNCSPRTSRNSNKILKKGKIKFLSPMFKSKSTNYVLPQEKSKRSDIFKIDRSRNQCIL